MLTTIRASTPIALALALACGASEGESGDAPTSTGGDAACGETPDAIVSMEACALPRPCTGAWLYGWLEACPGPLDIEGEYSSDERCLLDHLASGQPGRVALSAECGDRRVEAVVHVRGPGDATLAIREIEACEGDCLCDTIASWSPLEGCALRDPGHFAACLEAATSAERIACVTPDTWFSACAPQAPACTP